MNEEGLQDGPGTWNTTAADRWFNPAAMPPGYQVWNNDQADIAIFGTGTGAAGTVTLESAITAGGLTFNATGSGSYTLSGNVLTLAGTPIINANVAAAISSSLAGVAGMTKTGDGVLTLSGGAANTLTGLTYISGGTLTTAKSSGVTAIAGDVEVATGGTYIWGANNQLADTASITVSGGAITFSSRTETFANYTQTAGGQLGSNTAIVTITGTLAMSGGTPLTLNSRGRWAANAVDLTGFTSTGNAILFGGDGADVVTSLTVGSGGLTMTGQTITLNRTTTAGRRGNELILNGGITSSGLSRISTSGSGVLPDGAVNQLNLGTEIRTWNVLDETTTVSLPTAGTGGINKTGEGILVMGGGVSNTHSGLTTVTEGTLSLSKSAGVDAVGGDILVNGGTLRWLVADQVPDTATITVSSGPTLSFGGRNETFANYVQTGGTGISSSSGNSAIVTITGKATLSGGGAMTTNSGGRMSVNELDATGFSGTVLNIGGNSAARVTTFTIGAGGMTLSGQTISLNPATSESNKGSELILEGSLTATGTNNFNRGSGGFGVAQINLGTEVRQLAINAGTTTMNVPLIGTGGILKTGNGILRLTAASTFTGKTTVSGGRLTLNADGSIAESTWIQLDLDGILDVSALGGGFTYEPASGTPVISGSGTVNGRLNLGGSAQIRPGSTSEAAAIATAGDGIGSLTISGDLAFTPSAPGTMAAFQILNAGSADQIVINGDLTLNGSTFFVVTLDDDYVPASGDGWVLLDWAGLLQANGFSVGENNRSGGNLAGNEGNLDLPDLSPWGLLWDITPLVDGGSLTVTIVPEPGRMLLLALGLMTLATRRRRF
ncbi:autotransporter-associated beta strand repeat-containing protein [Prosthecobacter sp. SYSU 5D2]|uniref:beta strand repeat-containing protein n=1 Tax=Prosthecobacter sp. SYSU 5D2 TaxID=3134134 RepID=UPI0031FE6CBA